MYVAQPNYAQPDDNDRLWRYMTLASFVALLVEKHLFFSKLENLEDPFEGGPPYWVIPILQSAEERRRPNPAEAQASWSWQDTMKRCRRRVAVNCWHVNKHESEAMWKLYGTLGENVCVTTDLPSLRACFADTPTTVTGALVDYDMEQIAIEWRFPRDDRFLLDWGAVKRPSYRHEREFRLLHLLDEDDPTSTSRGVSFAVDPAKFVKEVILSPTMPSWQVLTIKNLVDKLGYSLPVTESPLLKSPLS